MLYTNLLNKKQTNIRVGVLLVDDNKNVVLFKHNDENIGKEILEIPYVELKKYNENDIKNNMYKYYGVEFEKINGYINESKFLDKKCNNITQINVVANVKNNGILKDNLMSLDDTYNCNILTNNAKQTLDIYQYNFM